VQQPTPENAYLIQLTIWCVTIVFSAIFISFSIMVWAAFRSPRPGAPKSLGLLFARANVLRLFTVLMVVVAVVFLELIGHLHEAAAAILSGIIGYVLGGVDKPRTDALESSPLPRRSRELPAEDGAP
jgi:hypothetical protein